MVKLNLKPALTVRATLRSEYGAEVKLMPASNNTIRLQLMSALLMGNAEVSSDEANRLTRGTDGGLYVPDSLVPDPLAYYILAKA